MPVLETTAHAKLNLTLDVLRRREDGYHDLRMVMQSVSLCDTITLKTGESSGLSVSTNLSFLPNDEHNLAAMAALRFRESTGMTWENGLAIQIFKRIPVCAGMGGGSSDAAAVLRALNAMTGGKLTIRELEALGGSVGSDVPYCVMGGTKLAEGRGEILTDLPPLPGCRIVICKPHFPVSTPELFSRINCAKIRRRPDTIGIITALQEGRLDGVARRLFNVFEEILLPRQATEITEIKNRLINAGALGAVMSGTGPTVFGIFDHLTTAQNAYTSLSEQYQDVFLAEPVTNRHKQV